MKYNKRIRSILLFAILSSAGLGSCQWDSATYDSYVAAFGEGGIEGFEPCERMEYILVRDTSGGEVKTKKLHRATCCNNSDPNEPCDLKYNELQNNKLCIAFELKKCPLTASRCMMETVTIINDNIMINDDTPSTAKDQNYCAEIVCEKNQIECEIKYKNLNSTQDEIRNKFLCLDPSDNDRCNATCPEEILEIPQGMTFKQILENHFTKTGHKCPETAECQLDENTESDSSDKIQYKCACPQSMVLCDNLCIDPATNTTYCGATGSCRSATDPNNYSGKFCTDNFKCEKGLCCNETENACDHNDNKCLDGFRYCEPNKLISKGRSKPTCLPKHPDDATKTVWNRLNFKDDGCSCIEGYENQDGKDENGCEVATLATKCGIVDENAVNCLEPFNASKATCKKENETYVCEILECNSGYLKISKQNTQLSQDINAFNYQDRLGDFECTPIGNTCCPDEKLSCVQCASGEVCKNVVTTDNPQRQYSCVPNDCPSNTVSCLSGCFPKELLASMHMDENCNCHDNYKSVNGYCERVINDEPYSCGQDYTNCYKILANASNITCERPQNINNHVCVYEKCISGYCDWDGKPENGCESKQPNGFKDCNSCINNALLTPDHRKCIQRGVGWSNQYWNTENLQYFCNDCQSGQFCCIKYSYGYYRGVCANDAYCY